MEANILLMKCPKTKKTYGVRIEKKSDGDWYRTWAFPIKERQAKSEGFDKTQVAGNLYPTEEYPGCPHCGSMNFVQCGKCKKISCWNGEENLHCDWCGTEMTNIVTATEKFNVSGDKF